ncbi:hypothetical protein [Paracraurococcus lichenis]|uniref:Uncharacterized protein n=1 Tax=Paracraurococcus lichenis TaxID=3064888 RepID=A0ABT9EBU5_9PROT|nr:hypothetical protein [Paracraurococcus sp. LOR1-02]MDO9713695.1 hypothetical protein [Paracraurococcus sp. LOR1-02]
MATTPRLPPVTLSSTFLREAANKMDLATGTGRASARLLVAIELGRTMEAEHLIRVCRAHGVRHVCTGHGAAHALAALAIPVLPEVEGRH